MPTLQLPVQNYTLLFTHNKTAGQPPIHARTRYIHIGFGPSHLLILGFVPDAAAASTGEIAKLANGSYRLSMRVPVADFAAYVDLLRCEQPLSVWVDYPTEPAPNQSVAINWLTLYSGSEPLGEGDSDTSQ